MVMASKTCEGWDASGAANAEMLALAMCVAAPDAPDVARDAAAAALARAMQAKHSLGTAELRGAMMRVLASNDARARARAWHVLASIAEVAAESPDVRHRALETLRLAPDEDEWHMALAAARKLAAAAGNGSFAAAAGALAVDALAEARDPLEAHAACFARQPGAADGDTAKRRALARLLAEAADAPPPGGPAVAADAVQRYLAAPGGVPTAHEIAALATGAGGTVPTTHLPPRCALAALATAMPAPLLALAAVAGAGPAPAISALAHEAWVRACDVPDAAAAAAMRALAYRVATRASSNIPPALLAAARADAPGAGDQVGATLGAAAASEASLALLSTARDAAAVDAARRVCGAAAVWLDGGGGGGIPSARTALVAAVALLACAPTLAEENAVLCSSASLWYAIALRSSDVVQGESDATALGGACEADGEELERRIGAALTSPDAWPWMAHHVGVCADALARLDGEEPAAPAGKRKRAPSGDSAGGFHSPSRFARQVAFDALLRRARHAFSALAAKVEDAAVDARLAVAIEVLRGCGAAEDVVSRPEGGAEAALARVAVALAQPPNGAAAAAAALVKAWGG